jgi:serine/threonine-protein kinase
MRDAMDSPRDDVSDPMIGRQVRDLRILERIGRGGMGAVYKAEHVLLREIRALKMIRAERFGSVPHALERFQREARIAVRLRHPNLVLIYDFFIEGGDQFLVMEYVVGESLASRIWQRGALSIDETCSIGIQCCAGMAHAHEMGIVHRDLSPENILLQATANGPQVKIIDFGIARAAVSESDLTRTGEETLTRGGDFLGKPRYASPEQAGKLRAGETLDLRSDLYTLGLILYEMVTGDLPFYSDTEMGYLSLHAFEAPAPPTQVRPDLPIPPALEQVILRCLEKERARRFQDASTLAAALEWAWHSGDPRRAPFPLSAPQHSEETRLLQPGADTTRWREAPPPRQRDHPGVITREGASGLAPLLLFGLALFAGVSAGVTVWWWTGSRSTPPLEPAAQLAHVESKPARAPLAEPKVAPPTEPAAKDEGAALQPSPSPPPTASAPAAALGSPPAPLASPEPPLPPPPTPSPAHTPAQEAASAPGSPRPAVASSAPHKASSPSPIPLATRPTPFTDEADMRRSFEEAIRFEESHDAATAIESWKRFRGRSPTRELDEEAKRRITRLMLAGFQDVR